MTRYVLDRLLATCSSDPLADTRDLAILLLAFASGGRLRSEVARQRVEQLGEEPLVSLDPLDPKSPTLPCMAIQFGRTRTGNADVFRAIHRWEALVSAGGLGAEGVFRLRSGYLTEAASIARFSRPPATTMM